MVAVIRDARGDDQQHHFSSAAGKALLHAARITCSGLAIAGDLDEAVVGGALVQSWHLGEEECEDKWPRQASFLREVAKRGQGRFRSRDAQTLGYVEYPVLEAMPCVAAVRLPAGYNPYSVQTLLRRDASFSWNGHTLRYEDVLSHWGRPKA